MGLLKHAQNGDLLPVGYIHSELVGAPFIGNLNDRPDVERTLLYLGGVVSRGIGIMATVNLMLVCAHILAALSFYIAARLWRVSRPFAWCLSVVYSFASYAVTLEDIHLPYIFFGLLPLQIYSCWYLSCASELRWGSRRYKLSLIIGFLSGFIHAYWVFAFLQLSALMLIRRVFTGRRQLLLACTPAILACVVVGAALSSHLIYRYTHGKNHTAVDRSYASVEQEALKPMDLVLPAGGQGFRLFKSIYSRYSRDKAFWGTDATRPYVGALAIAGLALLAFRSLQRALRRKSIPLPALIAMWVVAYSSIGGLHSLISLASEFYLIRTTARYSVVITSIGLLCLAFSFSHWARNWKSSSQFILGFVILSLGLVDQAGPTFRLHFVYETRVRISEKISGDKLLAAKLESLLPERAMVFMLPVVDFPEFDYETLRSFGWPDYELLRPIIYSTKLRFSYGSNKGRPEADWQHRMTGLPSSELVAELERYGFAGLLINRHGYEDKATSLVAGLAGAGYSPIFEQNDEWVFYTLNASETPVLPDLTD